MVLNQGMRYLLGVSRKSPKLEHGKNRIENKLAFLEELYGNIIRFWEKGYSEKQIFSALKLKEDYFIKYFCFGNVSLI